MENNFPVYIHIHTLNPRITFNFKLDYSHIIFRLICKCEDISVPEICQNFSGTPLAFHKLNTGPSSQTFIRQN